MQRNSISEDILLILSLGLNSMCSSESNTRLQCVPIRRRISIPWESEEEGRREANTGWAQHSSTQGRGVSARAVCRAAAGAPCCGEAIPVTPPLSPLPHSTFTDQEYKSGFSTEKFHRSYTPNGLLWIDFLKNWAAQHLNGNLAFRVGCPRTEDDSCRAGLDSLFLFFHKFGYCESILENWIHSGSQ